MKSRTCHPAVVHAVSLDSTFPISPASINKFLVTVLFAMFAFKNLGAIEATRAERQAIAAALRATPATTAEIQRSRDFIEPTLALSEPSGVGLFHIACDLLTIAAIWTKEWRRQRVK
jgi:hypothetical protein